VISIYQLCSLVYHLDVFHWSASHRYFTSCPIHTFNKHCRPEIPTAKPNSIPLSNTAYCVDLLAGLKNHHHHHRPQVTVIYSCHSIPPRVIETCRSPKEDSRKSLEGRRHEVHTWIVTRVPLPAYFSQRISDLLVGLVVTPRCVFSVGKGQENKTLRNLEYLYF